MTELILIRHGETDWNRELRFQGQLDVPLNSTGQEQAQRVARRLSAERIQQLVSSDLQRAVQTATLVKQQHGNPDLPELLGEAGLREQHFGLAEGLSVTDIKSHHPQDWEQWVRFEADYAFAGGETARQFHARVMQAVHALARRYQGQTVAVVTHGGVLDMIYRSARDLPLSGPRQCEIPNAGLSRVRLQGERIEILHWADTGHLADMPSQPVYDQRKLAQAAAVARTTTLQGS
jgi:2,3-bisphosphoglycerate-dependent phosphoglycerate mutase